MYKECIHPPQCYPEWVRGAPVSQNIPRVPPWGGWFVRAAAQILPMVPPSAPIHVGQEESGGSTCTRAPDCRPGDALHLLT